MVLLLSDRKNKCESEIIEILSKYGAQHISDKFIGSDSGKFAILSLYKKSTVNLSKGIAVFLDNGHRFINQEIPVGIIGICEEKNKTALEIFKKNTIAVISCGLSSKNSITLSSMGNEQLFACLQRSVQNCNGEIIDPCELKIKLTKNYEPFSVMASTAILLLTNITPQEF